MKHFWLPLAAAFLFAVLPFRAAHADPLNYTFSAYGISGSFTLPSNPTPSAVGFDFFQLDDVNVALSTGDTWTGDIDFFTAADGGGAGSGANQFSGPQLFSGALDAPTMLTGSFDLSGFVTLDPDMGAMPVSGTLVAAVAPTPEPSSWILLATGCGAAAVLAYRRRMLREPLRASAQAG